MCSKCIKIEKIRELQFFTKTFLSSFWLSIESMGNKKTISIMAGPGDTTNVYYNFCRLLHQTFTVAAINFLHNLN